MRCVIGRPVYAHYNGNIVISDAAVVVLMQRLHGYTTVRVVINHAIPAPASRQTAEPSVWRIVQALL